MAYSIKLLKNNCKNLKKIFITKEDRIFIFIVILSSIVIAVDYALIIKFIDIIRNI